MQIRQGLGIFRTKWFLYPDPLSSAFFGPYHTEDQAKLSAISIIVAEASIRPDALKQITDILDPEEL